VSRGSRGIVAAAFVLAAAALPEHSPARVDLARATRTITVTIDAGQGHVASTPAGLSCPGTCSAAFDTTQSVTLTATADSGYRFDSWAAGSGCSIQPACVVPASTFSKTVGAIFRPAATLDLVPNGEGVITVNPAGVDLSTGDKLDRCDRAHAPNLANACQLAYVPGTTVSLAALPDPGSTFKSFSDYRCTQASCQLTLAAGEHTLAATFDPLRVRMLANGTGRVVSTPSGIDCNNGSGGCVASYAGGTQLSLQASGGTPEWIAGCIPAGGDVHATTCTLTVSASPTWIVLRFGNADKPGVPTVVGSDLTVAVDGEGTVTGDRIDCGGHCSASYGFGTLEHLEATAAAGFAFTGWQGGCGSQSDCSFPVGPITAVKAMFAVEAKVLHASLLSVKSAGHRAKRKVSAMLKSSLAGRLTLRLERLRGKRVASRKVAVAAGTSRASLAVPRKAPPGRYRLRLTLVAGTQSATLTHLVRIGR
jgi:hypothetical protein